MANDIIQADYQKLGLVARTFGASSDEVRQIVNAVEQAVLKLKSGGWIADTSFAFQSQMFNDVMPGIQRLQVALADASSVTHEIARLMGAADEEAAGLLGSAMDGTGLIFPIGQLPHFPFQPIRPDDIPDWFGPPYWGDPGMIIPRPPRDPWDYDPGFRPWNPNLLPNILLDSKFPNTAYATQTDVLRRYLGGELTYDEAVGKMEVASPDRLLPNFVSGSGTIAEGEARFETSSYTAEASGTFGDGGSATARFDVNHLDVGGQYSVSLRNTTA